MLMFLSSRFDLVFLKKTTRNKCEKINAAFNSETRVVYFLSGAEYIKYNFRYNTEETVAPLSNLGVNEELSNPDAAYTDRNGTIHILKGCLAYSFKWKSGEELVQDRITNVTTLGLPCDVDAALNKQGDVLVTKGCREWMLNQRTQMFEQRGNITDRGLPCDLDAAVEWPDSTYRFIKGVQFWKYDDDDVDGPFNTDLLNLCSWNLCGEREWMRMERSGTVSCNGDRRLCSLRLNQITLAGLHNAGSGFDGGFGFLDCFLRNHGLSITEQLRLGIRHFDIDPCFDKCGLLGSCHNVVCGGGICPMLKQLRSFLRDHLGEIVTLNFNHEIQQPEKVFPALSRQLLTQLGPMLNKHFRKSPKHVWPTLKQTIRKNKRIFVFYAPIIERPPHDEFYNRYKWIHSERFYGSTWIEFGVNDGCNKVVNITKEVCESRNWRELLEVSIIPSGFCINSNAAKCRPFYHQSLRACEQFRFVRNDSPNVLLVDYPEEANDPSSSVFQAVHHQNIRNIYQHKKSSCYVKVDAAVKVNAQTILFFSGSRIITYDVTHLSQSNIRHVPGLESIDAAYLSLAGNFISVIKGCIYWEINSTSLLPVSAEVTRNETCDIDAAIFWKDQLYTFKGCNVTSQGGRVQPLLKMGLPCSLDAALLIDSNVYAFKGNNYWIYNDHGEAKLVGKTLDWNIDVVHCTD
nr:PI-PLC X domain-containing protein 1-like [Biomphalaria glabrata]